MERRPRAVVAGLVGHPPLGQRLCVPSMEPTAQQPQPQQPQPAAARPMTMSLRQRQIKRSWRVGEGAEAAGLDTKAAVATVAVGLKPGAMSKLERQLFGSRLKEYMRARCAPSVQLACSHEA